MTPTAGPTGVTFDAAPLIALDRDDRRAWARLRVLSNHLVIPVVPSVIVAQVWRSPRQARLGHALKGCRVEAVDEALARRAGELCAAAGTADVVDAIVVASAARRGDRVVTADLHDIGALAQHAPGVTVSPV